MMTTIAIHQPNYLPWLGYFHKIAHCDTFVFLDDVAFSKGSFTNRAYYRKQKSRNEKNHLTIPIKSTSIGTLIKDIEIDHSQNWQQRQFNQISHVYKHSTAYDDVISIFLNWLDKSITFNYLSDFNLYLIKEISQMFNFSPSFIKSSDLPFKDQSEQYLIKIIQYLKGDVYLSGQGAKKYQQASSFIKADIILKYSSFIPKPYFQGQGDWLPGLSILDKMMNENRMQV